MFSRYNRKTTIQKITYLVLASFICIGFLSFTPGCSSGKQNGKTLRLARKSDCTTLDPAQAMDLPTIHILMHLYEPILLFDTKTGRVKPNLVKDWKISDDGKVYQLILKKGHKFSDGSLLKAEDVVFTFKRQVKAGTPGYVPRSMALIFGIQKIIEDVTAIDEYSVEIKLLYPYPYFLNHLTSYYLSVLSRNSPKDADGNITQPIGSGPFILDKRVPGESFTLVRNPHYLKKDAFDKIQVKILRDDNSRILLARKGELDIVEDIPPGQLSLLKNHSEMTLRRYSPINIAFLAFNAKKTFSSPEVRLFVASNVDRSNIINILLHGEAKVISSILPQRMEPVLEKKMGSKQVFKLKIKTTEMPKELQNKELSILATPGNSEIAKLIAGQLQKVGLQANVASYDVPTTISRLKSGDFDLAVFQWNGLIPDLSNYLKIMFHGSMMGLTNFCFYNNESLNNLLEQFESASNDDERALILEKILVIMYGDFPILPLFQKNFLLLAKKEIIIPSWDFIGLPFYGDIGLKQSRQESK